jgi:hypothetical protein
VDATRGEGADHDEEQHDNPERAELMAKVTGADRVLRTFNQYPTRFHAVARTVLTAQADIIETRMQAEHPWENQTGEAERNLRCRLFDDGQRLRLRASHGVPYGIWLGRRRAARQYHDARPAAAGDDHALGLSGVRRRRAVAGPEHRRGQLSLVGLRRCAPGLCPDRRDQRAPARALPRADGRAVRG